MNLKRSYPSTTLRILRALFAAILLSSAPAIAQQQMTGMRAHPTRPPPSTGSNFRLRRLRSAE
jgi:hypothetical protein